MNFSKLVQSYGIKLHKNNCRFYDDFRNTFVGLHLAGRKCTGIFTVNKFKS